MLFDKEHETLEKDFWYSKIFGLVADAGLQSWPP